MALTSTSESSSVFGFNLMSYNPSVFSGFSGNAGLKPAVPLKNLIIPSLSITNFPVFAK